MIPTEDSKALVRLLAFNIAKDFKQAEELLQWAYKEVDGEWVSQTQMTMRDIIARHTPDRIDYNAVVQMWNGTMSRNVPKITKVTTGRMDKIKLRVNNDMGGWKNAKGILGECFRRINASDFCNGENTNHWTATFDWFFSNDKNWTKVMEGNYDNRRGKTDLEKMHDEIAKADAYYEQRYGKPAGPNGNTAGRGYDGPDEQ